jgi:hypothetical protein
MSHRPEIAPVIPNADRISLSLDFSSGESAVSGRLSFPRSPTICSWPRIYGLLFMARMGLATRGREDETGREPSAMSVLDDGQHISCDGDGCPACARLPVGLHPSLTPGARFRTPSADWLFVKSRGGERHYCPDCAAGYLNPTPHPPSAPGSVNSRQEQGQRTVAVMAGTETT